MDAIRTWTFEGAKPMTISVYKPVVTIRFGDGPEAELSPAQVSELSSRMVDAENFFDADDPEVF